MKKLKGEAVNILHATTDPTLLARLKQMLVSAERADIAVGYLFVSGFNAVAEELARLAKVRVLVGRVDRQTLEEVARGVQQAEALRARVNGDGLIRRRERDQQGAQAVEAIAEGIARLPQTDDEECGVRRLSELISGGKLEIKTYPKGMLHAKAYLCWYQPGHAEPGAAVVGSSNFTLAGFTGNTAERAGYGRLRDGRAESLVRGAVGGLGRRDSRHHGRAEPIVGAGKYAAVPRVPQGAL